MINKIRVRGFKKFADQEFEIPPHLVVVGANNSGKTTLLQTVGAWLEIALRWSLQNPDPAREDGGNYPTINITVDSFTSVPLANFDHLWSDQRTQEPLAVWLDTELWNVGFECLHRERELVAVRPAADVDEKSLKALAADLGDSRGKSGKPWRPVYIPPVSGVEVKESLFAEEATVQNYLAGADAGKVLRNLLWRVQENGHWEDLSATIGSFFGYELMPPSSGPFILAQYRHSPRGAAYDLSSAAGGFLQVLLIYAAILGRPSSVYLMDEPDAHLHISLQNRLFRDLLRRARRDRFQMIVATHSECLVREAARASDLRLFDARGDLRKVPDSRRVLATLALDQVEIVEALRERRLLYLEGPTDIEMLRSWAAALGHRCLPFLQRVTPVETAQRANKKHFAAAHFAAMRELIPEVRGAELRDGDQKKPASSASPRRKPPLLFWERKEIESYLLHPDSVARYLQSEASPENAAKALRYMKGNLPPIFFKSPLEESDFLEWLDIKEFFSGLFQAAGLRRPTDEDYLSMAERMKAEEIPPQVREKLDQIADCLGLPTEEPEAGSARGS